MNQIKLLNGAIFIADAHENSDTRTSFWDFLCDIKNNNIECSQLFLMGDMFDLLVGGVDDCAQFAEKYINILEEIAVEKDVFYLEGNHDFNLDCFFKNVKVFPISKQPLNLFIENYDCIIKIAHGDIFLPKLLQMILRFLRNKALIKFLNFLNNNLNFIITKTILKKQNIKNLFYNINDFEDIAKQRFEHFNCDIAIEGHFHQGKFFSWEIGKYFNLESFAQKKRYFIVEYDTKLKDFNLITKNLRS